QTSLKLGRGKPLLQIATISAFATTVHLYAEIVQILAPHIGDGKTLRAQVFMPESKSESLRPAAIMLHGCGGIGAKGNLNARHTMWKDWLVERGFIVVFPESFSSRGFEEICTQKFSDRTLKQSDRVDDVLAAKKWLLARKDVDANKLVLWGWSHGGGTVLATITKRVGDELAPETKFAQAISFYPGCTNYMMSARVPKISSPLALMIGEADDWTSAAPCKAWVKTLQEHKLPATITTFADAFHDFDNPNGKLRVRKDVPNGVKPGQGVTVGPNPQAREAVKKEIDALLRSKKLVSAL
ncbi:MAG: dienelactone hydrolase family protein, partial [Casimicrobium sp.]